MTRLFPLFLISSVLISCAPTQKIKLNTAAIPDGKTFYYRQTTASETTLESGDEEIVTREKSIQDFTYTLNKKNADGSSVWQSTISRFQMVSTRSDTTIRFDTDHPETETDPVRRLIFKQLVSTPFFFNTESDGTVYGFTGMDEMWQSVADSIEPDKKPVFDMMVKQFGNAYVADAVKNAWAFYSTKPIKKGKTWKKNSQITLFNARNTTTYHLDDIFANEVSISSTTIVKGDPEAPGELKMGPAKIYYYLNGKGKGVVKLDTVFGMVVTSESELIMDGKMEVKVPFLASQAMPMTIKTKVLLEQK